MTQVIDKLKVLQADSFVLYNKFHNFHWNVKGAQFYSVHIATERMYEELTVLFDDCAERVLQLGAKPYVTIKEYLAATRVNEEEAVDFTPMQVTAGVIEAYTFLLEEFKQLSDIANQAGDKGTVAFADEHIAKLEKDLWMLKAMAS